MHRKNAAALNVSLIVPQLLKGSDVSLLQWFQLVKWQGSQRGSGGKNAKFVLQWQLGSKLLLNVHHRCCPMTVKLIVVSLRDEY